jgi:hypothetical protein
LFFILAVVDFFPSFLLGPGLKLAEASVFISCVMSLAVFDISKGVDESGREIEPNVEYTEGTIRCESSFRLALLVLRR